MPDQPATRAAIARATDAFTFSRGVRQGGCDFFQSHREGPCATCVARDAHDAEIARRWRERVA